MRIAKEHQFKTDVLIIGGGTAAMRAAVAAAETGAATLIIQKGPPNLGIVAFNAPVPDAGDSVEQYFQDMVVRGQFLVDNEIAAYLTNQAIKELRFFEGHGLSFKHHGQSYQPRLTSGNTVPRTIYTSDRTGPQLLAVMQRLLRQYKVPIQQNKQAIQLLQQGKRVTGALAYDLRNQTLEIYQAQAVVIATGGLGPLYAVSNNHPHLSGDGLMLAFRAGAELVDMEFVQFEPFVIRAPHLKDSFGISFLLDDNPRIYNTDGDEFLSQRAAELGKDVLSRSLFAQIQAGKGTHNGGIFFDLTDVEKSKLDLHPRFLTYCRRAGFDPYTQPLDVGPSQHYLCGGVRIDAQAQSNLPGLYAAGEAAGGVHGADRLAGNSGSDVLVFGAQAGKQAAIFAQTAPRIDQTIEELRVQSSSLERFNGIRSDIQTGGELSLKLREVMWDQVGLIREAQGLKKALDTILEIKADAQALCAPSLDGQVKLLELENQVNLAEMIYRAALLREETRGVHYRSDYMKRKDLKWLRHIVFSLGKDGLNMETLKYKWRREPAI